MILYVLEKGDFMNLIHSTNYKIYNEKNNAEFRLCLMNDLHFSNYTLNEKLYRILKKIESDNPNYILFVGDLLDSVDMISDLNEKKRLLNWLSNLGSISNTFISLGSHDYCKKLLDDNNKQISWIYDYPKDFIEEANKITNVTILDNNSFQDKNIYLMGYTQGMLYFNPIEIKKQSLLTRRKEDKAQMIKELKDLKQMITNIPYNTINLLMCHSPYYLNDSEILSYISEFDYYLSGHMHNGLVPPIINELWCSKRGFIAPNRQLFADNERNTLINKDDKLIVNGPLTTFHENSGLLRHLNIIYPSYITTLDFTKDEKYNTSKIYTKKKYNIL